MCTIVVRNFLEFAGAAEPSNGSGYRTLFHLHLFFDTVVMPIIIVLGTEVLVDWLKHSFITKFNHIRPSIYSRFEDVLCRDYATVGTNKVSSGVISQSPEISRRIGLPTIPLVCLVLKSVSQTVYSSTKENGPLSAGGMSSSPVIFMAINNLLLWVLRISGFLLVYCGLLILKLMLGISVSDYARRRSDAMNFEPEEEDKRKKKVTGMPGQIDLDQETKAYLNDDRDNLVGNEGHRLWNIERYELVSKRIW